MDRQDTILILTWYKNRNRLKAETMDTIGDAESAQRYRDMADWFAEAIKREEALLEKGEEKQ